MNKEDHKEIKRLIKKYFFYELETTRQKMYEDLISRPGEGYCEKLNGRVVLVGVKQGDEIYGYNAPNAFDARWL